MHVGERVEVKKVERKMRDTEGRREKGKQARGAGRGREE